MKKALLFLFLISSNFMMAADVTPREALQKATDFLQSRNISYASNRAPITANQLTMTKLISGLYLFNVADNGGFVIVSNDDCTADILGFSDSGNIDPDNMPDNMRAWLQGYADQISWAKSNHVTKSSAVQRRVGDAAIEPLIKTKWDQGDPYNRLCPDFFVFGKSVVGCLATAMAQVVYYTISNSNWRLEATSKTIPAYNCRRNWQGYGTIHVDEIPAGTTFDWRNMLTEYDTFSDEQGTAVATLMAACGASIETDYANKDNGGSSASLFYVDKALKKYFGHSIETTQRINRANYSDDDWEEIIYHELSQGRPVLYSGFAKGKGAYSENIVGHAFVCDGYRYENSNNYYHINWGWSGICDNYFLLSAFDPTERGFGSETGNYTGFNYDQEVVIGMQLEGDEGKVADEVSKGTGGSLRLVDISTSSTHVKVGDKLTVVITIKNNSIQDYKGGFAIWLSTMDRGAYYPCSIGSGETVVLSQSVTAPDTPGTYQYKVLYLNGTELFAIGLTDPITVSEETDGLENNTILDDNREGTFYDLQGRRVDHPVKGVYLVNGRKVIVK